MNEQKETLKNHNFEEKNIFENKDYSFLNQSSEIKDKTKKIIYNRLNFEFSEEMNKIKKLPKSSIFNSRNIFMKKNSITSHKQLLIDENIIKNSTNFLNINNEKEKKISKKPIMLVEQKEIKKQVSEKTKENKTDKYYTPKKSSNYDINDIYKDNGKKRIKIIRKEKVIKEKKLPKHQHQAKKDMNEQIHMSEIKPQNDDKKEEMEIIGEEVEETNEINNEKKEENTVKDNEDNNKEIINEDKSIKKNELIDEFLEGLDNKEKENNIINISNNGKNKAKEEESEDPFEKAENEYRMQQNEMIEDEDDIIQNIELDINEIYNNEKVEEEKHTKDAEHNNEEVKNEDNIKDAEQKNEKEKQLYEEKEEIKKDKEKEIEIKEKNKINEKEIEIKEKNKINENEEINEKNKINKNEEIKDEIKINENEEIKEKNKIKENEEIKEIKEKNKINENEEKENDENKFMNINQDTEDNYYKIYLNSLQIKTDNFNPLLNKNPENLYLKEVYQCQSYREKVKKYNKKSCKFDLFLNKFKLNNIISKYNNNSHYDNSKENISNNTYEKYKKFPKEIFSKKIKKSKDYDSTKTNLNKYLINTISTTKLNHKKNMFKKQNSLNKDRRFKTEANIHFEKNNNNFKDMINFILDKNNENEKINKILNPINKRRNSEKNCKIVDILNDPKNPYSTIWPNKFLNINYNFGIHYTEMEQGVPQLRLKQLKKKNLPPLYYRSILNINDKYFRDSFTSLTNENNHTQKYEINCSNNNKIEILTKEENKNNDLSKTITNFHRTDNKDIAEIIEEEN